MKIKELKEFPKMMNGEKLECFIPIEIEEDKYGCVTIKFENKTEVFLQVEDDIKLVLKSIFYCKEDDRYYIDDNISSLISPKSH